MFQGTAMNSEDFQAEPIQDDIVIDNKQMRVDAFAVRPEGFG